MKVRIDCWDYKLDKIECCKFLRISMGCSLLEAKSILDRTLAGEPVDLTLPNLNFAYDFVLQARGNGAEISDQFEADAFNLILERIEREGLEPQLLSYVTALEMAREKVAELNANHKSPPDSLVLVEDITSFHGFGWMFYWTSRLWRETGDVRYALGGNAPFIIDRLTHELSYTGTASRAEYYVARHLKANLGRYLELYGEGL